MKLADCHGKFDIGIYVRESRDDNEENYETIETQRDLLVNLVEKENLGRIFRIYMDDNVSGSGFEREGIELLKQDVVSGKINLLLLKDLSRLGRSNAKTLLFLDFLEEYGVRVVTFDGRYDSFKDSDTVGIETWFNERYIRDISRKIRASLRFKISRGEYIGSAPYGYLKSGEVKNRLCVDESTACIVREIFRLYREGYGYAGIARILNSKGIPPPSGRSKNGRGSVWNPVTIGRILSNRVYTGDTVQGVSEKISFKSKKTRRLPENRWVMTAGTHEAIIDREEFETVRKIREGRNWHSGTNKGRIHVFSGILVCGACGSSMYARVRRGRAAGYICGNYCRNGRASCTSHHISEHLITGVIADELLRIVECPEIVKKAERLYNDFSEKQNYKGQRAERLERQLELKRRQQQELYLDKLEGSISEDLFLRTNRILEAKIRAMDREITRLKNRNADRPDFSRLVGEMAAHVRTEGLGYKAVHIMVDRITVYDEADLRRGTAAGFWDKTDTGCNGLKGLITVDFNMDKV